MTVIEKLGITPGPWDAIFLSGGIANIENKDNVIIANCGFEKSDIKSQTERRNNAKLISYAPEMIYTIIAMVYNAEKGNIFNGAIIIDLMREVAEQATSKNWSEIFDIIKEAKK